MQAVILAGGLGSRMRPFTDNAPKCLIPIHGKPFIDYQLELLCAGGVKRFVLCLGYLGEAVRQHIETSPARNLMIEYSWDSPESGGTAGALKLAESMLGERFFVTWGDSYVRVDHHDMMRFHCSTIREADVTMGVFRNNNAYDFSNVVTHGKRVTSYDRSSAQQSFDIDAGISVFEKTVLAEIPSHEKLDLGPLFSRWASQGRLGAFRVAKRFYEVGSWAGVADFERYLDRGMLSA